MIKKKPLNNCWALLCMPPAWHAPEMIIEMGGEQDGELIQKGPKEELPATLKRMKESASEDDEAPVGIGKKLKSLSIIESNIKTNNQAPLPKINLPVLRKVKIKKSKLPLDYFFESIVGQTSFLRIINIWVPFL